MRVHLPTTALRITAAAVGAALLLSGCTTSTVVAGSEVGVAVAEPFTSLNPATSYGRSSATNADVAWLTGGAFAYYDDAYRLVEDHSFGTAQIVAEDPLTVRYQVSADARWSDGTPVDAADLLLAWAADSGVLNTPDFDDSEYVDPETGRYTDDFPDDVVFFDGRIGGGLEHATQTPQLGDDGRTLFVHFDEYVPTWQTALAPGIPAHVLQTVATGRDYEDADSAQDDLVAAIVDRDADALGALARTWNDAYNIDETAGDRTPEDATLLLSAGPYIVTAIDAEGVTLDANPEYRGDRRPTIETIQVRYSPEPLETVRLLADGEVDIATVVPTEDTASALLDVDGVSVVAGTDSRIEHLDLQFADSRTGVFTDPRVRQAFLHVVPRQQILDAVVTPVQPDAMLLDSFLLRPGADGYADAIAENGSADYATTDVDAAADLLAEANVTAPTVCLLFDPASDRRLEEFALIQKSAARAGFSVTDCSSPDWQGLLGVAGAYDAALFAWDTTRLGPGAAGAIFRSDSALANFTRYANPDVDALVDELARATDPGDQARIATEIDTHLYQDAYGLPLYAYPTLTAVSSDVENVTRSPLARGVFWNAWEWAPASSE
ncbi:ABC transporter substrate-binding protein [Pseudolysinimonas yzui]|uniref:ABC transporter substrate-binding protein n=1 Tax=Pseudolysinimonas yzui TaxID=2708254 RepID=UPI0017483D64|nr:ABC transporter substrate-binding protein [Pseudolysinimonas yzui]